MPRQKITDCCLIVIPCLNERNHIGGLLSRLSDALPEDGWRIVVADGGSKDGSQDIVKAAVAHDARIVLLNNPKRLQSAAINLAVARFGDQFEYFIRMDAHGEYPDDYCLDLITDASETDADSIVVSLKTIGFNSVQRAAAVAQNSKIGNGGSAHRNSTTGAYVDHGHHALMRVRAFLAVGGYDETFAHNEDAELDFRLKKSGYKIWMSGRTAMVYHPRASIGALFKQYLNYGRGRAKNLRKHKTIPAPRQALPLAVAPAIVGAGLALFFWAALLPAFLWAITCVGYGFYLKIREDMPNGPLAGLMAMVMHFAWSTGFWFEILRRPIGGRP
ncbi:glycosyltransferase family 2 protein [Rhizobium sp. BE258]|uniref:glycosyltransferase family 2 protein n=1 Tax=Rhizobium sp. BE258 TaxID=2817722 RepID=UPI002866FAA7|nr:succinoglycan biosynthesis protein ExoA [Rhizobium sp. BE258]